jgi:hypothetical protein
MDLKTVERRVFFETPNTINLKAELWDKRPLNHAVQSFLGNSPTISAVLLIGLLFCPAWTGRAFGFLWFCIAVGITALFQGAVILLHEALERRQRDKQLRYRRNKISQVSALFAEQGFLIPEDEQNNLTTTRRAKFKLVNEDGVRYRTDFIGIDDETISATLYLSDKEVSKKLQKMECEESQNRRLQFLIDEYEAENGKFVSPDLRDVFIEGVRRASK